MKLNEIKTVLSGDVELREGIIPIHLSMTLERIIKDGKVTDSFQYTVLAGLVHMFKDGIHHRWPRDMRAYICSDSQLLDELKALSSEDHVALAKYALAQMGDIASYETSPATLIDWINTTVKPSI